MLCFRCRAEWVAASPCPGLLRWRGKCDDKGAEAAASLLQSLSLLEDLQIRLCTGSPELVRVFAEDREANHDHEDREQHLHAIAARHQPHTQ